MLHLACLQQWLYLLLILRFVTQTNAANPVLSLDTLAYITPCETGLRHNLDRFLFRGTANVAGADQNIWPLVVHFQIQKANGTYKNLCSITLSSTRLNNADCYSTSSRKDIYQLIVNVTSLYEYSQSYGMFQWLKRDKVTSIVSKKLKMTQVYGVNETFPLAVIYARNGKTILTQDLLRCGIKIYVDIVNTLTFCCLNYTTPCWSHISLNSSVVATGYPCAKYIFTPDNRYQENMTFSLAACKKDSDIVSWTCLAQSEIKNKQSAQEEIEMLSLVVICSSAALAVVFVIHAGIQQFTRREGFRR